MTAKLLVFFSIVFDLARNWITPNRILWTRTRSIQFWKFKYEFNQFVNVIDAWCNYVKTTERDQAISKDYICLCNESRFYPEITRQKEFHKKEGKEKKERENRCISLQVFLGENFLRERARARDYVNAQPRRLATTKYGY